MLKSYNAFISDRRSMHYFVSKTEITTLWLNIAYTIFQNTFIYSYCCVSFLKLSWFIIKPFFLMQKYFFSVVEISICMLILYKIQAFWGFNRVHVSLCYRNNVPLDGRYWKRAFYSCFFWRLSNFNLNFNSQDQELVPILTFIICHQLNTILTQYNNVFL